MAPFDAERMAAFELAGCDGEAARLLRIKRDAFFAWRKSHGIPAKASPNPPLPQAEEDRRRRAYSETPDDLAAARKCGLRPGTFHAWMRHRGLPRKHPAPKVKPPRGPPRTLNRVREEEATRRMEAYEAEASDSAAARRLSMPPLRFNRWRRAQGLPAKTPPRGRLSVFAEARRRDLYRETSCDSAAAKLLGVPTRTFAAWRAERGLATKTRLDLFRVAKEPTNEDTRRLVAYGESQSDTEAAARLGVATGAFAAWRRRQKLPNKYVRGLSAAENTRRVSTYRRELSDSAAAAELGIDRKSFETWRHRRGLPARPRRRRLDSSEIERRTAAWITKETDAEAAAALGLKEAAWRRWRHVNALPGVRATRGDADLKRQLASYPAGSRRAWKLSQKKG